MALPLARTIAESYLYMDLNPCACGSPEVDVTGGALLLGEDGGFVRRREGVCKACGSPRTFLFGLPDDAQPGEGSWENYYGGSTPSQLMDAGEWLFVAHSLASFRPAQAPPESEQGKADRRRLTQAIAAMDEVLKFIPAGAGTVPDSAFWTERGRAKRGELPGQFDRGRLEAYRGGLLDFLDRIGGPLFDALW